MALIAVDMTPVRPGGENGGAKIFVLQLLKAFQNAAPDVQFLLLTASWNDEELSTLDAPNMRRLCVLPDDVYVLATRRIVSAFKRIWQRLGRGSRQQRGVLAARGVDLLFCPFTAATYAERGIKVVSIVYDLQHLDLPQLFSSNEIVLRNNFFAGVKELADAIICISEDVRQSVLKHLKTEPQKTHAVHICIQSELAVPAGTDSSVCLEELGIAQHPYMFFPANFWPHKNHRMLLAAFNIFLDRHPESNLDLVFTGALDDLQQELKRNAQQMGIAKRVHFLGFISRENLAVVWDKCLFLVFPSLYEGFGIPVLEAMSFGKPVICSNSTSLPEVGGDAARYFDPRIPMDIVSRMEEIAFDENLRKNMSKWGLARASKFKTEDMVSKYLEIIFSQLPHQKKNSKRGGF